MQLHARCLSASIVTIAFCCVAAQTTATFTLKFSGVLAPGAKTTAIFGINNSGAMVGYYVTPDGTEHGLLLRGKSVTNIDHPQGVGRTFCNNLNSKGTIVGYYYDSTDTVHGFLYRDGVFTAVGPSGAPSVAAGINDLGEIVGGYNSNGVAQGFKWNGKNYTTVNVPGAVQTFAADINNSGEITFDWIDSGGNYQGALLNGNKYTTLQVPGAVQSIPNDIDSAGDVIFSWVDSSSQYHGAVMIGGTFHEFNEPDANGATYGSGINDQQSIVGEYVKNNRTESFKATY
jgi:probable HAF family extracellular repeat protein